MKIDLECGGFAEIVLDSEGWKKDKGYMCPTSRLTTFLLRYPRIIHAELLTHRVFSKNSASSRAIPIAKMIANVDANPFVPTTIYKNQSGMQGSELMTGQELANAQAEWLKGKDRAVETATSLMLAGVHKQHANRPLEPFSFITIVLTGEDFANFFALRYHKAAQPELQMLAKAMYELYSKSIPQKLWSDDVSAEWHIPFIKTEEQGENLVVKLIKSAARCARTSYNKLGNEDISDWEADLNVFNKLVLSKPVHASPFEHQACIAARSACYYLLDALDDLREMGEKSPVPEEIMGQNGCYGKVPGGHIANFQNWEQHRSFIKDETVYKFEPPTNE